MTDEKITDIETAIAFHDKQISELSDVLSAQWDEIEALKRKLADANNKISDLESNIGEDHGDVRPPHY